MPRGAWRALLFALLWLVLAGTDPAGLLVGAAATIVATRGSLALLPPVPGRTDPRAIASLIGGLGRESAVAGWDIALRALARQPRLAPGIVVVPMALAAGTRQDAFRLLTSLAPGSLPLGPAPGGGLLLHVLDTGLPAAAQMATIEADVTQAWRPEQRDG